MPEWISTDGRRAPCSICTLSVLLLYPGSVSRSAAILLVGLPSVRFPSLLPPWSRTWPTRQSELCNIVRRACFFLDAQAATFAFGAQVFCQIVSEPGAPPALNLHFQLHVPLRHQSFKDDSVTILAQGPSVGSSLARGGLPTRCCRATARQYRSCRQAALPGSTGSSCKR